MTQLDPVLADGWFNTDGGRQAAGFSVVNDAGDCFVRALSCAAFNFDYAAAYERVAETSLILHGKRTARDGVSKKLIRVVMTELGWTWTPTMQIGSGCQVHLRRDELPDGHLVVHVSKHIVCVRDGIVFDNHDPRRDGTRCVYGYWRKVFE